LFIRRHGMCAVWLRRDSTRRHERITALRNAPIAELLPGTP
jgi:hypothetical protein